MSKQQIERVFDKVLESGGKQGVSTAMREVGYPESTSHNPQKITNSKTWEKLMAKHFPDKLLAEKHMELLNKREVVVTHSGKETKVELTDQPHSDVKQALDMAYKLKDRYPKAQNNTVVPIQINLDSDREKYGNS